MTGQRLAPMVLPPEGAAVRRQAPTLRVGSHNLRGFWSSSRARLAAQLWRSLRLDVVLLQETKLNVFTLSAITHELAGSACILGTRPRSLQGCGHPCARSALRPGWPPHHCRGQRGARRRMRWLLGLRQPAAGSLIHLRALGRPPATHRQHLPPQQPPSSGVSSTAPPAPAGLPPTQLALGRRLQLCAQCSCGSHLHSGLHHCQPPRHRGATLGASTSPSYWTPFGTATPPPAPTRTLGGRQPPGWTASTSARGSCPSGLHLRPPWRQERRRCRRLPLRPPPRHRHHRRPRPLAVGGQQPRRLPLPRVRLGFAKTPALVGACALGGGRAGTGACRGYGPPRLVGQPQRQASAPVPRPQSRSRQLHRAAVAAMTSRSLSYTRRQTLATTLPWLAFSQPGTLRPAMPRREQPTSRLQLNWTPCIPGSSPSPTYSPAQPPRDAHAIPGLRLPGGSVVTAPAACARRAAQYWAGHPCPACRAASSAAGGPPGPGRQPHPGH